MERGVEEFSNGKLYADIEQNSGYCYTIGTIFFFVMIVHVSVLILFCTFFPDNIQLGLYDDADLERIQTQDIFLRGFIRAQSGDIPKAAAMIDASFQWRKNLGVNGESKFSA